MIQRIPRAHNAIIDAVTFEAAQPILAANSSRRRNHVSRADRPLLRWLVFDRDGQPMAPIITRGGGKRCGGFVIELLVRTTLKRPASNMVLAPCDQQR